MDFRFKLVAACFFASMMLLSSIEADVFSGFTGIFVTLGALLFFAFIALWPSLTRGDLADRSAAGGSWSDRIEFDSMDSEKGRES
ncbi:MAG: hypothetical protein K0U34_02075 [Alphaproteobacteria bacterium]|nr:hypothetical protein [Alphaproteobacteria bacterium]